MKNKQISGRDLAKKEYNILLESYSVINDPAFHIIYFGDDPVIDNFISYKMKAGKKLGVSVHVHQFKKIEQKEALSLIKEIAGLKQPIIIQLPVLENLDAQELIDAVPVVLDVDVLSTNAIELFKSDVLNYVPAVPGAIVMSLDSVLKRSIWLEKNIVLIGFGDLVGKPFADFLEKSKTHYSVIDIHSSSQEKKELLKSAEIIISGTGVPSLVKAQDVSEGVILVDAGTSEVSKKIRGDIDPLCYEKSSFYTPVPGGIGPLTIVQLYKNILEYYVNNR